MAALNNEGRWIEFENLGKAIKSNASKIKRQLNKSKSVSKRLKHKKKSVKRVKRRFIKRVRRKTIFRSVKKTTKRKSSKKIRKAVHRKNRTVTKVKPFKQKVEQEKTAVKEEVSQNNTHGLLGLAKDKKNVVTRKKPLNEALRDLNAELKLLLKDKKSLEHNNDNASSQMAKMQAKELQLRAEISKLMRSLSVLDTKKGSLKDKISSVDKQIDKVKAIRREMEEV